MTRPNVRVNGQNLEDINEDEEGAHLAPSEVSDAHLRGWNVDMEPFDEGFDRHIWSLSDQSLRWDLQIARERRTKPEEIEKQMRELLASQAELDTEEAAALAEVGEQDVHVAEESTCVTVLSVGWCSHSRSVPADAHQRIEEVASQTFALIEELKQVCTLRYIPSDCR